MQRDSIEILTHLESLIINDPSPLQGFSMLGSQMLPSGGRFIGSTSMIIGLGVRFGVSPLWISGHANGVPSRGISSQTLKALYIDLITT
jgi:hypothetical protein